MGERGWINCDLLTIGEGEKYVKFIYGNDAKHKNTHVKFTANKTLRNRMNDHYVLSNKVGTK